MVNRPALLTLILFVMGAGTLFAQQKIGYIDSEFILEKIPEYETVQQKVDQLAKEWQGEMDRLQGEVDELFKEYQARELLYTTEERNKKQEDILQREEEVNQYRMRHFGPEGELFRQQEQLMRPLQERVLKAVEQVASDEDYDYVFDKSGDYLFVYARQEHDLNILVLEELGIDTETLSTGAGATSNR